MVFSSDVSIDYQVSGQGASASAVITASAFGTGQTAFTQMKATDNLLGYNRATMTVNPATVSIVFSAAQVKSGDKGFDPNTLKTTLDPFGQSLKTEYFEIPASSQTCGSTAGLGSITDYVVSGGLFHDVYYDSLQPVLFTEGVTLANDAMGQLSILFGGTTHDWQCVTQGINTPITVSGNKFVVTFSNDAKTSAVIYLEPEGGCSDVSVTINQQASEFFTVNDKSYTGWIRVAFLPIEEQTPLLKFAPSPGTLPIPEEGIFQTIPDTTIATQVNYNQVWFSAPVVQLIAPQPFTFFSLFPTQWYNKMTAQALLQLNPGTKLTNAPAPIPIDCCGTEATLNEFADFGWEGPFHGTYALQPTGQAMALMLPVIAYDDGTFTFTSGRSKFSILTRCLFDLTSDFNDQAWGTSGLPTPPAPIGDSSESLFSTIFNMGFVNGQSKAGTIASFQEGICRPVYTATKIGTDVLPFFDYYRSAIPTAITDVALTTDSLTYTYDLATLSGTPCGPNTTDPLITFPGWFNVDGSIIDCVYSDTVKGKIFAAPAVGGTLTFLESTWASWLEAGDYIDPTIASISDLFGAGCEGMTIDYYLDNILTHSYLPWQPITNGVTSFPWPAANSTGAAIQPLFLNDATLQDGYSLGKELFQLAMTAQNIVTYQLLKGATFDPTIKGQTEPLIDYVKRYLYDFIVNRIDTQNFFALDGDNIGVCFNGDPIPQPETSEPPYTSVLGYQNQSIQQPDFGNPFYNDHILQYGYYMQALALVMQWDLLAFPAAPDSRFIRTPVLGADGNLYLLRHFADMIWRDTLNPYILGPDDFPFLRGFYLWEGHGSAEGIAPTPPFQTGIANFSSSTDYIIEIDGPDGKTQFPDPISVPTGINGQATGIASFMPTGRNLESIAESYNMITGVMFYAKAVQDDNTDSSLSAEQITLYSGLQDAALMLAKLTSSSSRVLWYLVGKGFRTSTSDPDVESFYTPFYKNYSITTGNIYDSQVVQQVAYNAGSELPAGFLPAPFPTQVPTPVPPPAAPPPFVPCPAPHTLLPAPSPVPPPCLITP